MAKSFIGTGFLVLFALFWTVCVGVADGAIGWALCKQAQTSSWPTASGTILVSELRTSRGSRGRTNYHPRIEYTYTIGPQQFSGNRTCFGIDAITGSQKSATDWLNRFPAGAATPVYYNPDDHKESTLHAGMHPAALFPIVFLLPFNAVLLALWGWALGGLHRAITRPPVGGLRMLEQDGITLIRVAWLSPFYIGLVALGVCSFICIFIVALLLDKSPTMTSMGLVLSGLLIVWIGTTLLTYLFGPRKDKYLVIAPADSRTGERGTLTIPAMGGVKTQTAYALSGITDINQHTVRQGKSSTTYLRIEATLDDGTTQRQQWSIGLARDRLDALITYLKQRTGLMNAI